MKKLLILSLLIASQAFGSDAILLPNLSKPASGTTVSSKNGLDVNVINSSLTVSSTNASIGSTGSAVPGSAAYMGANKSGNLTGLLMGQQLMTNSLGVTLASDQSALPVSQSGTWTVLPGNTANTTAWLVTGTGGTFPATQSGTWNLNNISGTVSLPTGAATAAKQPALGTAGSPSSDVITVQGVSSMTALKVDGSAVTQPVSAASLPLPTGATTESTLSAMSAKLPATLGQKAMANALAVSIASDQSAVPASQSGTWSTRLQDGSGNAITSTTTGSNIGIHTKEIGRTAVDKARNDYSSVNVTTSAYVQLVSSLAAEAHEVEIFDSSGQTLLLATGGAGVEADKVYIVQGGNGRIPLRIASGTRVAVKAVSGTASSGEIVINFYGL